jgi:alpha-glucosidase
MRGGVANAARVLDPFEQRVPGYGLNRDPERSPMQWNGALHAGFTTGTPWLPLAPDYDVRNVEGETVDPNSLLALYRRLIALRRTEPALSGSGFTILPVQNDIISYARSDAAERLIVVLNVSAQGTKCRMPGIADGEVLLSTHHERIAGILGEDEIVLRANEGVIIRARAAGSDRHRSGESSP